MDGLNIYQVDAFTGKLFAGNPAAICPLNDWLPDGVMQSIALENNLSETAFFIKNKDQFFIRWFTPTMEINLCGHATLATAHVMFSEMGYQKDTITFHTKTGDVLNVFRDKSILRMDFPSLEPHETDQGFEEMSSVLGACPASFLSCHYGIAVFDNEEDILKLKPNFNALMNVKYDGIIATAPGNSVDFVSRFFAPKLGIPEDPVTGSAHCELIPYWSKCLNKKDMTAKQLSKRGGEVYCSYLGDRVLIGGEATTYLRGEITPLHIVKDTVE